MKTKLKIGLLGMADNANTPRLIAGLRANGIELDCIVYWKPGWRDQVRRFKRKLRQAGVAQTAGRVAYALRSKASGEQGSAAQDEAAASCRSYFVDHHNSLECQEILVAEGLDLLLLSTDCLLTRRIFNTPRLGTLNAHPGWLPRFRGLGSVYFQMIAGFKPAVTIHRVDEGVDTGPIYARESFPPPAQLEDLDEEIERQRARMLADVIRRFEQGEVHPIDCFGEPSGLTRGISAKAVERLRRNWFPDALREPGEVARGGTAEHPPSGASAGYSSRVCIMTSVHPVFDTRIFHKQAKSLFRSGYDVTLIAQHDRNEVVDGVKVRALRRPKNRVARMLGGLNVFALALEQDARVHHFHDPELLPVGILLKLAGKTVIYDAHEDAPRQILTKPWLPSFARPLISRTFALAERASLPFFDSIVVAADDIADHFPPGVSSKVFTVRNFPSLMEDGQSMSEPSRENGPGVPTVIYVGVLTADRGVREMVDAVNLVPSDIRLQLVGTFADPTLEAELRASAGERVEFVGQVPYDRVWSLLCRADIGLVCFHPTPNNKAASWRNNKLFEYMLAGIPMVAPDFDGWREIVEDIGCGRWADPLNPTEIAAEIEFLITHGDLARSMGDKGRTAIEEKYNWDTEGKKLLDVYEDLIQ